MKWQNYAWEEVALNLNKYEQHETSHKESISPFIAGLFMDTIEQNLNDSSE